MLMLCVRVGLACYLGLLSQIYPIKFYPNKIKPKPPNPVKIGKNLLTFDIISDHILDSEYRLVRIDECHIQIEKHSFFCISPVLLCDSELKCRLRSKTRCQQIAGVGPITFKNATNVIYRRVTCPSNCCRSIKMPTHAVY